MILNRLQCSSIIHRSINTCKASLIKQDMVAPRLIATELLKKRKEDRERSKNTILNSADIQVLGSNCQGYQPSLLVTSEGRSYLFNCGEGTQRNCYANKVKLINLEHLFLTHLDWPKLSGSYGVSLTLQDLGSPSFTVHGTRGINDLFHSVESFLNFNTGIDCKTAICDDGDEYRDSSIYIKSVILDKGLNRDNKKAKRESKLISYICSLPDLPGTLDPKKCRQLGVPVGPKLAILKSGCDVTLENGAVIKSSDVCGPKMQGLKFLVVDCPSVDDVPLLINNSAIEGQRQLRMPTDGEQIGLVIHFSPDEVICDQKYIEWMDGFDCDCKHLILANSHPKRPNFLDSYRMQYLLQHIDKDLFPELSMPNYLSRNVQQELSGAKSDLEYGLADPDEADIKYADRGPLKDLPRIHRASALDKFAIRPTDSFFEIENRLSIDAIFKSSALLPGFDKEFEEYEAWLNEQPTPASHEPEVVFLGTGSALPNKLRNTSCILVNTTAPKRASIILDCGEDSYGQMLRFYGPEAIQAFLKDLRLIYISHHHADHHIGLISILRQLKILNRADPVILLIPPGIENQLNYYHLNFEDLKSVYTIISTKSLKIKPDISGTSPDNPRLTSIIEFIRDKTNCLIQDIKLVGVEHCAHSCAVSMDLNVGHPESKPFRISYSGDARPSEDFALIGRNSDLLIHEATFDFREQDTALVKKHCTTSEAIAMSKRMRAKYTILTHFSQRYPKIPYFTDKFDESIGFAFDNMALRCPTHYPRLPKMKKIFSTVFSKSLNEIDAKYLKKIDRKEAVTKLLGGESSRS